MTKDLEFEGRSKPHPILEIINYGSKLQDHVQIEAKLSGTYLGPTFFRVLFYKNTPTGKLTAV